MSLDKTPQKISKLFDGVAYRYDLLNDVMTGFSHRITRKLGLNLVGVKPNSRILDVATGTGDFPILLTKSHNVKQVIGIDISENMLHFAKLRTKNQSKIVYEYGNALELNFEANQFDLITIGYGIRNVPDTLKVLTEMNRVTKSGGKLLIVEATPPQSKYLNFLTHFYFKSIVPLVASLLAHNGEAYRYFAESVYQFPIAPKFCKIINSAGWVNIKYKPLYFGTVTIFLAEKP